MGYVIKNNAIGSLAGSLTAIATSMTLQSGQGALFAVTAPDYTYATLDDGAGAIEVVKVTAVVTDTLTIVRAQDGTTGVAWNIGAVVECRPCKVAMTDLLAAAAATQAEQEAGSSTTAFVTPGRQQFHPSAAKAWALETQSAGTYSNPAGYNITSISKNATGSLTVTIATDFSGTNAYAPVVNSIESGSVARAAGTLAAGSFSVRCSLDSDGTDVDVGFALACFGDQA